MIRATVYHLPLNLSPAGYLRCRRLKAKQDTQAMKEHITVPMRYIGPVRISSKEFSGDVTVPLATFESPMWPSTNRGASVSRKISQGITCTVIDECMTRSVLLETDSAANTQALVNWLNSQKNTLAQVVASSSRHATLVNWHYQIVGNLLYLRLQMSTGNAAGHNMATKAADAVLQWLQQQQPQAKYVSISGNYCTDKKVSAVNGILGRGKYVVAEICIPHDVCVERLKTTPEAIVKLHIKKNLIGSIVSGGLRSANAHFANLLLALYLATGQDAANIVEGSQGIVHTELREADELYFSVTLPNIIVGTVGNGKELPFVMEHLRLLGCDNPDDEHSARKLAVIIAATVLCGELSLLAAQTQPGELMQAHLNFERGNTTYQQPSKAN